MVRINIINPKYLADQHLVAEYLEIIMLVSHTRKHPNVKNQPDSYCLGKGHINFFKNKLLYLKERHELLKKEMKKRGFKTNKTLSLKNIPKNLKNNWKPKPKDKTIIKQRLIQKLKLKPTFYKYYKQKRTKKYLLELIKKS